MVSLPDRIAALMKEMGWTSNTRVAEVAGVSRSAVAQWRGQAGESKTQTIKIEPAMRLERASVFSAEWIATGKGPRMAAQSSAPAAAAWPFEGVARERFDRLTERQKGEVEAALLHAIEAIEARTGNRRAA